MRPTALRAARAAALVLLVAALPVAACSSGQTSYCDTVRSAEQDWGAADANLQNPVAAARFVATVKRVEAVAPAEVKNDWKALVGLFEKFTAANPDLGTVTQQMQGLQSAAKRIETHAAETCGVDLGS